MSSNHFCIFASVHENKRDSFGTHGSFIIKQKSTLANAYVLLIFHGVKKYICLNICEGRMHCYSTTFITLFRILCKKVVSVTYLSKKSVFHSNEIQFVHSNRNTHPWGPCQQSKPIFNDGQSRLWEQNWHLWLLQLSRNVHGRGELRDGALKRGN